MNDSTTAVPTAIEHERSATAGAKSAARSRGRFRKGRSGNPRGRPKGSRNIATVVKNILAEKVTVRAGGSVQRVTKAQAFTLTMLNDAIKGKPQATEQVLMLAERAGRLSSLNPECQRGVLVVPGVSKSREDWERDHGADARGEKIFNREGRPIVTLAFTPEQGRELLNAGRLDEALACYHHVLANYAAIRDRRQPSADDDLDGRDAVIGIGILSILFSFGGEFTKALACADEAISWFTPYEHHPVARNYLGEFRQLRGDALMFLGRTDEGREFYLSLRGKEFKANGSKRRKTWESLILRQFDRLREHGRSHPLMDEIETAFAAG